MVKSKRMKASKMAGYRYFMKTTRNIQRLDRKSKSSYRGALPRFERRLRLAGFSGDLLKVTPSSPP